MSGLWHIFLYKGKFVGFISLFLSKGRGRADENKEKISQIWCGPSISINFPRAPRWKARAHSGCISLPAASRILMTYVKCIHYTDVGFPVPVNSVRPVDYCCCLTGHAHFRRNNFVPRPSSDVLLLRRVLTAMSFSPRKKSAESSVWVQRLNGRLIKETRWIPDVNKVGRRRWERWWFFYFGAFIIGHHVMRPHWAWSHLTWTQVRQQLRRNERNSSAPFSSSFLMVISENGAPVLDK